ncbi:MAG: polyphosphate kinase 1 [Candidatus Competibacteraceae bacterium]|nr:polyphosphate kinase 1 [Candidatus Competibacteraceae bacterium]
MSAHTQATQTGISLTRVKPKRRKKAQAPPAAATDSFLASREGLLAHAWRDRDLGWLDFNARVLHEALDERTPLLERLKFLAIFTSNLDEFYMKRVGLLSLKRLAEVREKVLDQLERQARCYRDLTPRLAEHGIFLVEWEQLTDAQREEAGELFDHNVSPALTPLGMDPAHPFPFMSNLSINWGFILRNPETDEFVPVRVKIPTVLPSWVRLKADTDPEHYRFLRLVDLIRHSTDKLFPGMELINATLFRILRNAEVELDEDDDDSLREVVAEALQQRRFEPVVRLDLASDAHPALRQGLMDRFDLENHEVYEVEGLLDYTSLFQIAGLDRPELRDPPWNPLPPPRLPNEEVDIFAVIRAGDLLLHHPYECFDTSVEDFISDAAVDPQTVAIKMTVYRIGDDTPFVQSLIRAAESGKQVACVIELKARFDEERNLGWAKKLEKVGAHVTYGVLGLKTHTKVALVVRKEGEHLRSYAHIGTGNYHIKTSRLYTDVGLLTCDSTITTDVVNLFHYLTGVARTPHYRTLLIAPTNMRQRFLERIEREIENHRAGQPARIIAKMNQVEDLEMGQALAAASQAGVPVDLIVRGFCCLIAGVPGWTENVRVRSIIGRFLEHSRIFHFANGQENPVDGEFIIGSADWMHRNLSARVEAATPVADRTAREQLWDILDIALKDQRQSWLMQPDGSYRQNRPAQDATGPAAEGTHAWLMDLTRQRVSL